MAVTLQDVMYNLSHQSLYLRSSTSNSNSNLKSAGLFKASTVHSVVSFCCLIKGISPKICILCVRVKISKRSFETFLCLDQNFCFQVFLLISSTFRDNTRFEVCSKRFMQRLVCLISGFFVALGCFWLGGGGGVQSGSDTKNKLNNGL